MSISVEAAFQERLIQTTPRVDRGPAAPRDRSIPISRTSTGLEYYALPCRTILNRCTGRTPKPFAWTINPYRGCETGCVYCFARYTHRFMDLKHWADFESKIYVKQQAAEVLRQDLARCRDLSKPIALGTACDLYQPAERTFQVTRSLLEALREVSGLEISLATKSDLVTRDIDLFSDLSRLHKLHINISVTTPRVDLVRRLEPRAPSVSRRLAAVRILARAGLSVGILIMPVLPCLTDGLEDLDQLVHRAADSGARWVEAQTLWLCGPAAARFYPFLEDHAPHLVGRYRRRYDRHMHAPAAYREWLAQRVQLLRDRYGLAGSPLTNCNPHKPRRAWTQADLFSLA